MSLDTLRDILGIPDDTLILVRIDCAGSVVTFHYRASATYFCFISVWKAALDNSNIIRFDRRDLVHDFTC